MFFTPIAAFAFAAALAAPQTREADLAFEVASVKVSGPQSQRGSEGGPGTKDPGRYSFNSATLEDLIGIAYDVKYFQISSKTPLERDRFDLAVKIPEGATKAQFRIMMVNLLADRFHLNAHFESRDYPAYELVVARGGPKLAEAAERAASSEAHPDSPGNDFPALPAGRPGLTSRHTMAGPGISLVRMRARQQTISTFAESLRPPDDHPVVDKTGLTGKYDFVFEYSQRMPNAAPDAPAEPSTVAELFVALQQQMGLQLVSKKLAFKTVVVESVDRVPAGN